MTKEMLKNNVLSYKALQNYSLHVMKGNRILFPLTDI